MSPPSPSRSVPAIVVGAVLFACGYVSLNLPEQVLYVLSQWRQSGLGPRYLDLQNAMPMRLLAALPFCLPGALLMAFGLGRGNLIPAGGRSVSASTALPGGARAPGLTRAFVTLALLQALATAWLMQDPPQPAASYTWVAGIVAALVAAAAFDRSTGVGLPKRLLQPRDRWIALALFVGTVVVVGHDVGHWRWSGTPDEFSFFAGAKGFYDGVIPTPMLSEQGVFAYHPVLSSYYQVAFMRLLGPNVVAWRLSSVVSLAVAVVCTFQVMLHLYGRRSALCAAVLLATSQIAMAYSHLGYNNAQVYGAVLLPLALAAWAARGSAALPYALTGLFCGLCFYTYFTARLAPLLVILLWWHEGTLSVLWRRRALSLSCAGMFLLTIVPTLMQLPRTVAQMIRLTGATANQNVAATEAIGLLPRVLSVDNLGHIGSHWLLSIFYPMTSESGHFMLSPVSDVGTSFLWLLGLSSGLLALRRRRWDFLTVAYLGSAFAVGAISPYPHPALTRVMFLAPFTAMLAAVAIELLLPCSVSLSTEVRQRQTRLIVFLITSIALANVYRLHHNVYDKYYGYGDGTTSEVVRLVGTLSQPLNVAYIQRDPTYMSGTVPEVLKAYAPAANVVYVRPPFTEATLASIDKLAPPLIVAYDLTNPEERQTIETLVQKRFPNARWTDSAPGRSWNIRYVYVADALDQSGAASIHEPLPATSTPETTAANGEG